MPGTAITKTFCTSREAATLLGVSVGTVQLWVESGLLQAWKTNGGHRRVLRDSIERLLHQKSDPTATLASPAAPLAVSDTDGPRRLRVLAVDDDPLMRHLYQTKISDWPMAPETRVADCAIAALMMIGRQCPDLLITDLQMPGMDGFQMLRVLRDTAEMAGTTIVAVSGMEASQIAQHGGLPAGVELIGKPVPFQTLQSLAMRIVHDKQLDRRSN
jgi:excisionase family DNA binding protein